MSLNKFTDTEQKTWMNIGANEIVCDNINVKNETTVDQLSVSKDINFEHTTTPANPVTNSSKVYVKADGNLYILDDVGTEVLVGDDTGDLTNLTNKTQNLSLLTTPSNTLHVGEFESDTLKIKETSTYVNVLSTTTPPAGENKLYFKGDVLYQMDSSGTESAFAQGSFLPLAGGNLTGPLGMGSQKITGLADPTALQDAATKAYVDTSSGSFLPLAGGTLSGDLDLGSQNITNIDTATAQDLVLTTNSISLGLNTSKASFSTLIGESAGGDDAAELNTCVGYFCGSQMSATANNNTLVGTQCDAVDNHNVCIGSECSVKVSGSNNTLIGVLCGLGSSAIDNVVCIGNSTGISNLTDNTVAIGSFSCVNAGSFLRPIIINSSGVASNPFADDTIKITTGVSSIELFSNVISLTAGTSILSMDNANLDTNGRDIIATTSYGSMYFENNATATVISVTDTWTKAVGITTLFSPVSRFTMPADNRLTYTGAFAKVFKVSCHFSFTPSTPLSRNWNFVIYKNGTTPVPGSQSGVFSTVSTADIPSHTECLVALDSNDYLELWCKNVDSNNNLTVEIMNMIIMPVLN